MEKKLRVGIIGNGAIGSALSEKIKEDTALELVFVFDTFPEKSSVKTLEEGLKKKVDLVVECACAEAVLKIAQTALPVCDLMLLSSAAFADKQTENEINALCKKHGTKVFLPSGAIIALDGIRAVRKEISSVQITSTKNPKAFGREDKTRTVLFEGTAREAAKLYPKNVNVAATLALNSIGLDKTQVKIISDPNAQANTHEIEVEGEFGKFLIRVENKPSKNPKTSALAAKTTFEAIKNIKGAQAVFY